jgi:molecular chaperone GrpE (heat shock protein)
MIDAGAGTAEIDRKLDQLLDLFQRRLLDDRGKSLQIAALQQRLDALEQAAAAEAVRPLVGALALVLDRIGDQTTGDLDFLETVTEELHDALAMLGVQEIECTGDFDPRRHEVVTVVGGVGDLLTVTRVIRRGYQKAGVTLRPARVEVRRSPRSGPAVAEDL